MRKAAEARGTPTRPRVVYTDLDGTLLGPGGSLFAAPGGGVESRAAEALAALGRSGVALVPVSGRTATQVWEVARIAGSGDYIAEMGGIVGLDRDRERIRSFGAYTGSSTPYREMAETGAAGLLLDAYRGRLEPHAPWAFLPRECSMLLRGQVDVAEARSLLEEAGSGWLDLLDNGVIPRPFPGLDVDEVHAYHLLPRGVSKAAGARAHRERRSLAPEDCIAIGDAPSDAAMASEVGAVFIVENGREAVEAAGDVPDNVFLTSASHGAGFAEAVAVAGLV